MRLGDLPAQSEVVFPSIIKDLPESVPIVRSSGGNIVARSAISTLCAFRKSIEVEIDEKAKTYAQHRLPPQLIDKFRIQPNNRDFFAEFRKYEASLAQDLSCFAGQISELVKSDKFTTLGWILLTLASATHKAAADIVGEVLRTRLSNSFEFESDFYLSESDAIKTAYRRWTIILAKKIRYIIDLEELALDEEVFEILFEGLSPHEVTLTEPEVLKK